MKGSFLTWAAIAALAGVVTIPAKVKAERAVASLLYSGRASDASNRSVPRRRVADESAEKKKSHVHGVRRQALPATPRVPLVDEDLESAVEMDALAASIFRHLTGAEQKAVAVKKSHREAIIGFYNAQDFRSLWVGELGLSVRGKRLLSYLGKASEEGLQAHDYLPTSISAFDQDVSQIAGSMDALARLDLELTVAALDYAKHASAGRIDPIRISEMHTIEVEPAPPLEILRRLWATVRPDQVLSSLHPDMPQYRYLKTALSRLRENTEQPDPIGIPDGPLIRPGERSDDVALVRNRLVQLDILKSPVLRTEGIRKQDAPGGNLYDPSLVSAVKRFQEKFGLRPDGIVGPNTRNALSGRSGEEKLRKILMSMERLRWLPADLKDRYIFVNQAAFQTWLVDSGEIVFRSDVIVGKPKFQTAVFVDEMEYVVFNPYWTVPRSMAVDQMLPKLKVDREFLARQGFQLLDQQGQQTPWRTADWNGTTGKNLSYSFRQPPGANNALGALKFLFPNSHSIYMHDTPARHLFNSDVRAFSYGCVRVMKAHDLATVLLAFEGWTPQRVDKAIRSGKNQQIKLRDKIPVYLGYYTAWADSDGSVRFKDDVYGRDRILAQALGLVEIAAAKTGATEAASN